MQPKFTQQSLGSLCLRIFATALIFFSLTQISYSQRPGKSLTKEEIRQQDQKAYSALTSTSDVAKPAAVTVNKVISSENIYARPRPIQTDRPQAVCTTFNGSLATGDQTMTGRLTRGGVVGTCGTNVFPGTTAGGPFFFDTYTWTNPQVVSQCVNMSLTTTDLTNANIQAAAYNGSFVPTNLATNFLGDPGLSTGTPQTAPLTFSFTAPAGATIVFVVFSTNANTAPSGTASAYSLAVDGICTPCVPVAASAPIVSPLPPTVCAGTPTTLSVIGGSLNGAANWVWYSGSCGGTLIGTGASVTVTPLATTTYFVRGEGGCAPAAGPCTSRVLTVSACTCLSPDVATICAGAIQPLAVNGTFTTFTGGAITIVDNTIANPYPSTINVAGLPATGAGVSVSSVTINGLVHTFPSDIDILLQSPTGQNVVLMSDAGGGTALPVPGRNITLDDGGSGPVPTPIVNGTFTPTNVGATDPWIAPGPGSITQATPTLASFTGAANPNGAWKLFIVDDALGDFGTITSWSITFRVGPTAVWTANPAAPNTIFSNPGATTAYIAGTQTERVWVKPTATTVYTATITGGTCAGANNVTVNVNQPPTITVSPNPGGCSPATLTATGAIVYNWTGPAGTLNTTTGPTVIATTPVNANYTVTGIGANGCAAVAPVTVPVTGSSISAVISSLAPPPVIVYNEGFEATTVPTNWAQQNLSQPIGTLPTWVFNGSTILSPAQNGSANSYALGNFANVAGANTISNWLFTPTTTLANGDQLTFWTRTVAAPAFADRLQVRMSTNGASVDAGTTSASVGDFTTLLLDINPTLTTTGYPAAWTLFTVNISGLAAPISGRLAFRYFVTNGGPAGANSDNIGIDNVSYLKAASVTCAFNTSAIKVDITGGAAPYTVIYSDGTTNRTVTNYTSGTPIQVTPGVTTSYTIVSVTGVNGCAGSGNSGTAVITVTPPPSITTQPVNRTICDGQNTTFTVTAGPALGTTYQWQVSTAGGPFTNLTNTGVYSGVTTATLTLTAATIALNGNAYRVVVTGACPPNSVTSTAGTLSINVPPTITTQPANTTKCVGATASFSVVATGNTPTYQWQVSTNLGLTWTAITGATAATFSVTAAQILNNNQYRVIVTVSPCATTVTSNAASLTVNPLPTVTISSPVLQLIPGRTSAITAVSTPTAASYVWTLNGTTVAGVTGSTLTANINGIGTYRATATDGNGCVNTSNNLVIGTEASDHLFIYPNPTTGVIQARLYYGSNLHERREVTIYNAQGQLVAKKSYDLFSNTSPYLQMDFDLSRLGVGTYVMKVTEKNTSKIVAGKFVILR